MPTKDSFYNIAKELEVAQENEGYLIVIRCGAFFTSIGANAIAVIKNAERKNQSR